MTGFCHFVLQIIDGVRDEMNRLYAMFCTRNPHFLERNGKVSVVAHSLGSVIAYDILTLWDIEMRHLSHDATTGTGFLTESLQYLRSVTSRTSLKNVETGSDGKRKENLRMELAKARSQVMKLEAMVASEVEHETHGADGSSDECPYALRFKVQWSSSLVLSASSSAQGVIIIVVLVCNNDYWSNCLLHSPHLSITGNTDQTYRTRG